jgi:hypothetical protein
MCTRLSPVTLVTGCVFCLLSVGAVRAAPPLSPAQKRTVQRLALTDARYQLWQQIAALPLGRSQALADALPADVQRDLRRALRTAQRAVADRLYSDGVAEVDVTLGAAALRDLLIAQLDNADEAAAQLRARIITAARNWPLLWATGRAELPRHTAADRPTGWENITPEGIATARREAIDDAYAALWQQLDGLSLPEDRTLAGHLAGHPAVQARLRDAVRRTADLRVTLESDQTAVARVTLEARQLLDLLIAAHTQHAAADQTIFADLRHMILAADRERFAATGLATPPLAARQANRYQPIERNAPDWIDAPLTATGRFMPPAGFPADAALRHERARIAAFAPLRVAAERLLLPGDVPVADFLAYHQDLKDDVALWLSGARPAGPLREVDGGVLELPVELPPRRLWEILCRRMILEEIDPPERSPTPAPNP